MTVWTGSRAALLGASTAPFGDTGFEPILEAWLFDPAMLQWSTSSSASSIRDGDLSAAHVGGVIVFDGDGAQLDQTPPFLVYEPGTDTWSQLDAPRPLTYTPYFAAYGDQLLIGLDNRVSALTEHLNTNWQSFIPRFLPKKAGIHRRSSRCPRDHDSGSWSSPPLNASSTSMENSTILRRTRVRSIPEPGQ